MIETKMEGYIMTVEQTEEQLRKIQEIYKEHNEIPFISSERNLEQWLKKASVSSSEKVPKRNMERTEEGLLPGDIILLWRISLDTYTTLPDFPKYFEYDYGIDAPEHLKQLTKENYIYLQSAIESLPLVNVPGLKMILTEKGLKTPSKLKKDELIEYVKNQFTEKELDPLVEIRGYRLTEKGKHTLDNNSFVVDKHPKKNL